MLRGIHADPAVNRLAREVSIRRGVAIRADVMAMHLSHGEQRQLEIAMVLATQPAVVLLDEPLAGMGQSQKAQEIDRTDRHADKMAERVLVVEHDMDAVFAWRTGPDRDVPMARSLRAGHQSRSDLIRSFAKLISGTMST